MAWWSSWLDWYMECKGEPWGKDETCNERTEPTTSSLSLRSERDKIKGCEAEGGSRLRRRVKSSLSLCLQTFRVKGAFVAPQRRRERREHTDTLFHAADDLYSGPLLVYTTHPNQTLQTTTDQFNQYNSYMFGDAEEVLPYNNNQLNAQIKKELRSSLSFLSSSRSKLENITHISTLWFATELLLHNSYGFSFPSPRVTFLIVVLLLLQDCDF